MEKHFKQSFSIRQESATIGSRLSAHTFRNISTPGIEINMPRLTVLANEGENEEKTGRAPTLLNFRYGIFRGDKLVGFLDAKRNGRI